ncbi:MAG: hypothetical protein ACR650_04665 [Methylocystis sp.]
MAALTQGVSPMAFIELILTVCALSQPSACDERKLMLESATGSTSNCMMQAMPYIAQWSGEHPNMQVTRWRCVRPGSEGDRI